MLAVVPRPAMVSFVGGVPGSWRVERITTVVGARSAVDCLDVVEGEAVRDQAGAWVLRCEHPLKP